MNDTDDSNCGPAGRSPRLTGGSLWLAVLCVLCVSVVSFAQVQRPQPPAAAGPVPAIPPPATRQPPTAEQEDARTLAGLWGSRYHVTPGDVIQFSFPYVPEFDQTVSVQPDGYISLRGIRDLPAAGRTVPDLRQEATEAYAEILREPVLTLVLKEFEKPYVIVGGEVSKPGKYELRGAMTVTQVLAIAGGKIAGAKVSDVVLFRRFGNDLVDVKRVDVKKMYATRNLSEDPVLRAGDTVFVPKTTFSKIEPFLPKPSLGFFMNPFSW